MKTKSETEKVYKFLAHRAEVDDFRQANAGKRRQFWNGALRYDAPLKDENGNDCEDRTLSDNGKAAELIRLGGEKPLWFIEMTRVLRDELDEVESRVVDALIEDMRPAVAARIVGVNRQRVYRVLDKLRVKLAKAHALYKRGE